MRGLIAGVVLGLALGLVLSAAAQQQGGRPDTPAGQEARPDRFDRVNPATPTSIGRVTLHVIDVDGTPAAMMGYAEADVLDADGEGMTNRRTDDPAALLDQSQKACLVSVMGALRAEAVARILPEPVAAIAPVTCSTPAMIYPIGSEPKCDPIGGRQ